MADYTDENARSSRADNKLATEEEEESLVTAPDGGYGWVVVMAAFVCNLITDGTAFSFGVLYDDLLDHFDDSKSKTSWIGSIFMGVPLLASPIASALINKFGCRTVSVVGGFISTLGFVMSYFAQSIEFLCFSFGFVSGVGLSMVYTPAVVIVAFYFEKKRALATGLSVAGSGIGTLAFAPLVEYLTVIYGWKGTILILAGIMLNTCVFGALYRPLPDDEEREVDDKVEKVETVAVYDSATDSSTIAKMREMYSDSYSHSLIQFPTYLSQNSDNGCDDKNRKSRVTKATSNDNVRVTSVDGSRDPSPVPVTSTDSGHHHDNVESKNHRSNSQDSRHRSNQTMNGKPRSHTMASSDFHRADRLHPLYRRDIFYKGSLLWLPQDNKVSRTFSCPHLNTKPSPPDRTETQWNHVKRVVREMLDVSIFKQPLYLLFFISNFLLYMWYDIPYFYLPNSATDAGLSPDQASWIISVIGIGNTIGQVAFGVVADIPCFNNSFVYGFGIFMCGVSILFIPLCNTVATLSIVGSLFGLFIGANYALCSIIIVDLLSLDELTNAYGIVLCGQGVANLIGPPIGGLLSDKTHSYVATYLCAGAFIALSGLIMLAVAVYEWRKPKSMKQVEVLSPLNA